MANTNVPMFAAAVKSAPVALTATGNNNVDGSTGTYTTIYTAGLQGARVERIVIVNNAAVADKVSLWLQGKCIGTYLMAATGTLSATVGSNTLSIDCSQPGNCILMTAGDVLKASLYTGTSVVMYVTAMVSEF